MRRGGRLPLATVFFLAVLPGCLILLLSRGFISCGIGATDWWWGYGGTTGDAHLHVDSDHPVANKTIWGDRVVVSSFNTCNNIVSITVVNSTHDIILNYSGVSGEALPGITYPPGEPRSWVRAQNITVFVYWQGVNTTVHFNYYTQTLMHADGTVCHELRGYREVLTLGFLSLGLGIIGFTVYAIMRKKGQLEPPGGQEEHR